MLKRENFTKKRNWFLASIFDLFGFCISRIIHPPRVHNMAENIKKILIIRTDGIGDVLMTMPLFKALKEKYPNAFIDCLIRPRSKDIFPLIPYVSNTFISYSFFEDIKLAFLLYKNKYDVVISPRVDNYIANHAVAFIIGRKRRVGFAMKGGGFFLTDVVPWCGEKVLVELSLDIANVLCCENNDSSVFLNVSDKMLADGAQLLKGTGLTKEDVIIGINPFAYHPYIWVSAGWVELIKKLIKEYNAKIIFIGTSSVVTKVLKLQDMICDKTISLAGKTNFIQLLGVINHLDLLVTVDSGPRHIANALGIRVVSLRHGVDSNILWGRYCDTERVVCQKVPCSPCGQKNCSEDKRICMTSITPDDVINAINIFLRDNK
jgi:ADP-heptose:LPS heptosyltransferase